MASNWQGHLNTIKADAKGRYPSSSLTFFLYCFNFYLAIIWWSKDRKAQGIYFFVIWVKFWWPQSVIWKLRPSWVKLWSLLLKPTMGFKLLFRFPDRLQMPFCGCFDAKRVHLLWRFVFCFYFLTVHYYVWFLSKEDIYTSKVKYILKRGKPYIWVPEKELHNVVCMV